MLPGMSEQDPNRIRLPSNIATFIGLIIYLHRVGFPGHWLSDYLQIILFGSMVTDLALWEQEWPVPLSDMTSRVKRGLTLGYTSWRTSSLKPRRLNVLFGPSFARSPEKIGTYATCMEVNTMSTMLGDGSLFHPRDPNMILVFFKEQPNTTEMFILRRFDEYLVNRRSDL